MCLCFELGAEISWTQNEEEVVPRWELMFCCQKEGGYILQKQKQMLMSTLYYQFQFTFEKKISILVKNYYCLAIHILGVYFVNSVELETRFFKK